MRPVPAPAAGGGGAGLVPDGGVTARAGVSDFTAAGAGFAAGAAGFTAGGADFAAGAAGFAVGAAGFTAGAAPRGEGFGAGDDVWASAGSASATITQATNDVARIRLA